MYIYIHIARWKSHVCFSNSRRDHNIAIILGLSFFFLSLFLFLSIFLSFVTSSRTCAKPPYLRSIVTGILYMYSISYNKFASVNVTSFCVQQTLTITRVSTTPSLNDAYIIHDITITALERLTDRLIQMALVPSAISSLIVCWVTNLSDYNYRWPSV